MMGMGVYHSCFGMNGTLRCFGYNQNGQLGYGDSEDRGECGTTYEDVSTLSDINLGTEFHVVQIQMMNAHGCALSSDSELKCWGKYSFFSFSECIRLIYYCTLCAQDTVVPDWV